MKNMHGANEIEVDFVFESSILFAVICRIPLLDGYLYTTALGRETSYLIVMMKEEQDERLIAHTNNISVCFPE